MGTVSRRTIRSIALPAEHGAWSLWLEPTALALLIAPSVTGLLVALSGLSALLIRQPLKVILVDLRRRKIYRRTQLGAGFLAFYSIIFAILLLAAIRWAGAGSVLPLLPALLVATLIVLHFDVYGDSRGWLPEVLASVVMAAFAVSICLAADWSWEQSLAVAGIALARAIPAIIYVRARLHQIKNDGAAQLAPVMLHIVSLGGTLILMRLGLAPALATLASLLLLLRAWYYLRYGPIVAARVVGIQEVVLGLSYVAIVACGFRFFF